MTWRAGVVAPPAHSGNYLMECDVLGSGVTGLRLELPATESWPVEYTVRAWVWAGERTVGDASSFVGFRLAESYPTPTSAAEGPWSADLGWEALSATQSRLQLGGWSSLLPAGLAGGRWHLVQVRYSRLSNRLSVWLNGVPVADDIPTAAGGAGPQYAMLGAWGAGPGARQNVYFDDVSARLGGEVELPLPGRLFGMVEGREHVVQGERSSYRVRYGNGYPLLGVEPSPGDDSEVPIWVGVSLPTGYQLLEETTPSPSRVARGEVVRAVWEVAAPYLGEENYLHVEALTPEGAGYAGPLVLWRTTNAEAAFSDPPAIPDPERPYDPVWGWPGDLLPQYVIGPENLLPDLWVRKRGPLTASPGDAVYYTVAVGNQGYLSAEDIVVRDRVPEEMGGGDRILATLAGLEPGGEWRGLLAGTLRWGIPDGTLVLNEAYVPTGPAELRYDNNSATWTTTILAAHDPNAISVSPEGGVDRGDTLTYTLECENIGAGTAYGVYATTVLDRQLDDRTLSLPEGVYYDRTTRTIVWEVGTLGAGEGSSTSFTVGVAGQARRARPVIGQATVYFPSVPEETPTNVVVNIVKGSFPDVPWDHWALLAVECAHEAGIVGGYPDGTYRPTVPVSRDQMAVFVARAMAGGDANIPTGPATATFEDVPTDHWAFPWVEYAVARGIVQDYDPVTYAPTLAVDRGQMAVFVARGMEGGDAGVPEPVGDPLFSDVPADHWARRWIEHCVARGVVAGYPDGTYGPNVLVSRDQMAVFVQRAFRLPM